MNSIQFGSIVFEVPSILVEVPTPNKVISRHFARFKKKKQLPGQALHWVCRLNRQQGQETHLPLTGRNIEQNQTLVANSSNEQNSFWGSLFVCLFVFCVWKINTSNSHAPESCLESTAGTWNPCEECSIRVTRVADQIRSVMSFYFQQGTHAHAHPHAHTVEAARSRWSPRRGSRWRSDSLRLRSSSAARTPGYVPPSARLHLRRSLLEISRWRRSLVGTSFPPGRHALLLDTRRVDPRRRTPLWTSRQGMVSFFNVMCWR